MTNLHIYTKIDDQSLIKLGWNRKMSERLIMSSGLDLGEDGDGIVDVSNEKTAPEDADLRGGSGGQQQPQGRLIVATVLHEGRVGLQRRAIPGINTRKGSFKNDVTHI